MSLNIQFGILDSRHRQAYFFSLLGMDVSKFRITPQPLYNLEVRGWNRTQFACHVELISFL